MIKKIIILSTLVTLFSTACNSEKKQIHDTALEYIIATGNYRLDDAMPYATKETREVTLPALRDIIIPAVDSSIIASNTPATATIDNILIQDDTAWVDYTKTTPAGTSSNTLYLIKEDGKWLVDVVLNKTDE